MKKNGRVRIIGGKWKKHIIRFPVIHHLRPTTDSMRETLFNWFRHDLFNGICLDLFAGSGVIGFEAASRGAQKVIMIDKIQKVVQCLKKNREKLGCKDQITIIKSTAKNYLKHCQIQFDFLFLDPPYDMKGLPSICQIIDDRKLLRPGANIYIEAMKSTCFSSSIPSTWHIRRTKQYGTTSSALLIYQLKES